MSSEQVPQPGPCSCISFSQIKSIAMDFWYSTVDCCCNGWESFCDLCSDGLLWVHSCCCGKRRRNLNENNLSSIPKLGSKVTKIQSNTSSLGSSAPNTNQKLNPTGQQVTPISGSPNPSITPRSSLEKQPLARKLSSPTPDQTLAGQTSPPSPEVPMEPPKIDFIETGSIFGDRKRINPEKTLQIENGRFKSPGQPKVVQGPGGRSIRVTFMTGFPPNRSLESFKSINTINSRISGRRSYENNNTEANVPLRNSLESLTKTSKYALKSVKSIKSWSSVEREGEPTDQ